MKFLVLAIVFLLGGVVDAFADNLGCFNGSDTVHILAQFTNSSGVATSPTTPTAKIFSPTDTTTASFTPTLAEIDAAGSPGLTRGSFSLGASPTAGTWTVQYKGTVGGNVLAGIDVFQVPCPKMAIKVGGIPAGASGSDGTLSTISATTLTLSSDMISAANQFAYQARIEVVNPTTYLLKGVSCVTASTTAAGPADTVTTAEDISTLIAVSDAFYLIPDPTCRNLRPTTAGNTFDVASTGEGGVDFSNVSGTLDAGEIGTGAITNAKFAVGAIDAAAIAAGAITSSEAPNLDAAVSTRLATTAFDTKIPSNFTFTAGNVHANAQVVADKTGYSLTQTFPTNFSSLAITAGGAVTVGTNNDKTNYSLNFGQTLPASPTADTVGEGLKFAASRLDAAISTRLASASYTAPDNANITNIRNYLCNGTGTCNAPTNIGVWDRLDAVLSSRLSTTAFDTKIPTALTFTGSLVRSQIGGLDSNAITAAAIQDGAIGAAETGLPTGTVSAGSANCNGGVNSTTVFATSLNQTVTNFWTSTQLITITSGALSGQTRQISGYTWTGSVGCLTVATAFTGIPADGVSFFIINK